MDAQFLFPGRNVTFVKAEQIRRTEYVVPDMNTEF